MSQKHFKIILSLAILTIFLVRFFYSLPNAPLLDADAISSVQAARSIIETGIPARNGIFYPRDYLAHYLLAGSIFLIGDNPLGYAAPNLIFSVLVLILLYFVARILTDNKIVIFLTILFVGISSVENTFAINPRSYMQFQFFFLLTIFCFYKGFVKDDKKQNKKYQILTLFSYIASALSHASGVILLPIFGFYLMCKHKVFTFKQKQLKHTLHPLTDPSSPTVTQDDKWYRDKLVLAISIIVVLFSVFLICVKLPIDNQPTNPNKISFNLPCGFRFQIPFLEKKPTNLAAQKWNGPSGISFNLTSNFPYLFTYLPFICLFIFAGIIKLTKDKNYKLTYFYYIFLSSLFFISLLTLHGADKYIFCIFPIFALLVFLGTADFIDFIVDKNNLKAKRAGWITILALTFFFMVLIKNSTPHPIYDFRSLFNNPQKAVSYLSKNKKEKDIIIADDAAIYRFYLDRHIYYLRQRVIGEDNNGKPIWSALEPQKQSPYIIDSLDKLKRALNNNRRVWLVASKSTTGPEIVQYIKNNMELKFLDYPIYIYFSGE